MADTVKTIGYSIYENCLREEEGVTSFYARVNPRGRVRQSDLADMIVERNSTVSKQEVLSVLQHLEEVVFSCLQMGFNVQTGLFSARMSIRGAFDSMEDEFEKGRHTLKLNMHVSPSLRKRAEKDFVTEKAGSHLPVPSVFELFDYDSRTTQSRVTPGNVASITGNNFRFDPADERQGIFFLNGENPEGVKVESIIFAKTRNVVFTVPASLEPGNYTVQVRCGFGADIRAASMKSLITVSEEVTA
ncbi:MAG: DUF4469 domain-containing protein [Spirochaetales bacterium]|nr:DUF4469 domain-containing protein [Spirochaetales bacterium]